KGVLISMTHDSTGAYAVTIDEKGRLLTRHPLRWVMGMFRMAPPPDSIQEAKAAAWGRRKPQGTQGEPALPLQRPSSAWKSGDWNQLELILDLNLLRGYLNDGNGPGGAVDSLTYGAVALYAGGTGEVRFKDLCYKDLAVRTLPAEKSAARWRPQRI